MTEAGRSPASMRTDNDDQPLSTSGTGVPEFAPLHVDTPEILEALPFIVYVFDVQRGVNLYVNRMLTHELGYAPEAIERMGLSFMEEILHPDDRAKFPEMLARWDTAEDGVEYPIEYRVRDAAGHWRWYRGRDRVYARDAGGKVQSILGVAQEITEQRRFEESLLSIAAGVSSHTSAGFFHQVVQRLAEITEADLTFIGQFDPLSQSMETLAVWGDGALQPSFRYDLQDTPCENVLGSAACVYPDDVQQRFPKDQMLIDMDIRGYVGCPLRDQEGDSIGILVALSRSGFAKPRMAVATLEIFAGRASSEIMRRNAEHAIQQRVEFESAAARLAGDLLDIELETLPDALNRHMDSIVDATDVDRIAIYRRSLEFTPFFYRWSRERGGSVLEAPAEMGKHWPWLWRVGFKQDEPLLIESVDDLPPEAEIDKQTAARKCLRSLLWIPLRREKSAEYAIVASTRNRARKWTEETKSRLEFIGDLVGQTLDRCYAERTLRVSEEEFRGLFNSFAHPITIFDIDGNIMRINSAGAANLGRTVDECTGGNLSELLPGMAETSIARARDIIRRKTSRYYEDRLDLAPGVRWFWSEMSPFVQDTLDRPAVQVISYDITERTLMQAQHEHQQQFQVLLAEQLTRLVQARSDTLSDTVHAAIEEVCEFLAIERASLQVRVGAGHQPLSVAWAAGRMAHENLEDEFDGIRRGWRWIRDRALRDGHASFSSADQLPSEAEDLRRMVRVQGYRSVAAIAVRTEDADPALLTCVTETHEHAWDSETIARLRIFAEMVCTAVQRISLTESLQTQEERLRLALHGADLGIFDIWILSERISVDMHFAELLESSQERLEREAALLIERIAPHHASRMRERYIALVKGQIEFLDTECQMRTDTGANRWFAVRTRVVQRDAGGRATRLAGTLQDISGRKATEERLERYNEQMEALVAERTAELVEAQNELLRKERLAVIGRVTATVSHEIRNPLGTMRSALYTIAAGISRNDAEGVERSLQLAERNIQRCDRIITELLDYTRPGQVVLAPIDLSGLVDACVAEIAASAPASITTAHEAAPSVRADSEGLRRALVNVINNAVQAAFEAKAESGRVCVTVTQEAGQPVIVVDDNGPGIPPDIREHVFEPLFSTKNFGVGLGMCVVHDVMAKHAGVVELGEAPDGGARVVLRFPAPDAGHAD